MASILSERKDRKGFEVRAYALGKTFVCWIGPLTVRQQREYERHVSAVIDAYRVGASADVESIKWFDSVPARIRDRFVSWGMLPAMQRRALVQEQRTVGGWTRLYIDELPGVARTKNNYEQARTWLLKAIDAKRDIASITTGEMRRFQSSMSGLALSSRNKHLQRVKTMLAGACEDGLIAISPASGVKEERSVKRIDRSRQYFVDATDTQKVLAKLPDTNWRLIFALMRFQGLRRHEVFAIDWSNIDWQTNELTIPADTKTGWRSMPIFPETLEYLRDAFETAKPGEKLVRWSGSQDSLTELLKKRVRAILGKCWPKACQQLRSTRRTELDALFPSYVVNEWLGHDTKTAERHYQQVTPEHLSRASGLQTLAIDEGAICAMPGAMESHRTGENSRTERSKNPIKTRVFYAFSTPGRNRTCD